jgi:hypothetical protein
LKWYKWGKQFIIIHKKSDLGRAIIEPRNVDKLFGTGEEKYKEKK